MYQLALANQVHYFVMAMYRVLRVYWGDGIRTVEWILLQQIRTVHAETSGWDTASSSD